MAIRIPSDLKGEVLPGHLVRRVLERVVQQGGDGLVLVAARDQDE